MYLDKVALKQIEDIEKHLPSKRKALLYSLRENNWEVVRIDDEGSDWGYDQKWVIESTRENKGFIMELWFFKYDGLYDGMDRVVATPYNAEQPHIYSDGTELSIEFDGRKFEKQLSTFIDLIHQTRLTTIRKN